MLMIKIALNVVNEWDWNFDYILIYFFSFITDDENLNKKINTERDGKNCSGKLGDVTWGGVLWKVQNKVQIKLQI